MPLKKDSSDFITKMRNFLRKRELRGSAAEEEAFEVYIAGQKNKKYDSLKASTQEEMEQVSGQCDVQKNKLVDVRMNYLQNHQNVISQRAQRIMTIMTACCQSFPAMNWKNTRKRQPSRQRQQWSILRRDFVYKIRSAIKEAYVRRDELNRIIRNLNFGKDRYQFKITRNKGADGAFMTCSWMRI